MSTSSSHTRVANKEILLAVRDHLESVAEKEKDACIIVSRCIRARFRCIHRQAGSGNQRCSVRFLRCFSSCGFAEHSHKITAGVLLLLTGGPGGAAGAGEQGIGIPFGHGSPLSPRETDSFPRGETFSPLARLRSRSLPLS